MKVARTISALVAILIVMPIWYYLVHFMLVHSGAGDLQMFLFWVYVPFGIFTSILTKMVEINGGKS